MIRQAQRRKAGPGQKTAFPTSIAAPVGGWNAKDPLANMKPNDAILLDNWYPRTSDVVIRAGAENHQTGYGSNVRTLMTFAGATTQKLFAATDTGIFDASAAGAVGAAVTSVTNGVLSYINFNTLGGNYLIAVNGTNPMKRYDGTTWSDITGAITGVTTSDVSTITVFKRRIWMIKKDSMSAYYLPVDSIAGTATEFPLGQLCPRGGSLVAIGSWTIDGGTGSDDHLVFVTSRGEVLVYRGTDPASASTFALVGVYFIGPPIGGFRSLVKYGGDLLLLTQVGLYPLSRALQSTTVSYDTAISAKIEQPFAAAGRVYGSFSGWQQCIYPRENALIINIPIIDGAQSVQYVMNSITKSWCRFLGWNAFCFEVFNDQLYYGGVGIVAKAWTGTSDFGGNIVAECRQAFNYFGIRGMQKHVKLVRPVLSTDGPYSFIAVMDADFEDQNIYTSLPSTGNVYGTYDISLWDNASWAPDMEVKKDWITIFSKPGFALSLRLRVGSNSASVGWIATDYVVEKGGVL